MRPRSVAFSVFLSTMFTLTWEIAICNVVEHPIPRLDELMTSNGVLSFDTPRPRIGVTYFTITDEGNERIRIGCFAQGYSGTMKCSEWGLREALRDKLSTVWWSFDPPYGKIAMQVAVGNKVVFPYEAYKAAYISSNELNRKLFGMNCRLFGIVFFAAIFAMLEFAAIAWRPQNPANRFEAG